MSEPFPMDPNELAVAIDIPLAEWPGNCHGIAEAVRDLVPVEGLRVARGFWLGHVSRKSVYHRAPMQHSWLVAADGRILDPTRWAIESPDTPRIYLGICDDYDEGGRLLATRRGPPFPGSGKDHHEILVEKLSEEDRRGLAKALGTGSVDPRHLGESLRHALRDDPDRVPDAGAAFALLRRVGAKAIVPIDSWIRVMEPERIFCRPGSNRTFALPPAADLTDTRILFEVLNRFLAIEEREDIERELEQFGYDLQKDLWPALNSMERFTDMPISVLPRDVCSTISEIAGELLGKGFGEEMRVERFASSIGAPPARLADLLRQFGKRSGYLLEWDVPSAPAGSEDDESSVPVF